MSAMPPTPESRADKAVVLLCWTMAFALYLFLFRVLEGSWGELVRDFGGVIAPVAVYLGLVMSIMIPARRAGTANRWWVLLLLPLCGALAGLAAHAIDPERGTLANATAMGVFYGSMHALLLRWSYRREARRAQSVTA
jgi:hypothetical protein